MTTKESRWGLIVVAVAAISAVALVAIQVLTPNTAPQTGQSDRLDRIERQLARLLEQDRSMTGSVMNQQQATAPTTDSQALAKRLDDLEARLQTETDDRIAIGEERKSREINRQKIQSATNDPILRKKFTNFLADHRNNYHNRITETFQNEGVDPEWADERLAQINAAFSSPTLGNATISSSDCRTSMCKVVFSTSSLNLKNDPMFENEMMAAFSKTLGDISTNMKTVTDSSGNVEYQIYIFRDASAVPSAQNPLSGMGIDEAVERLNADY